MSDDNKVKLLKMQQATIDALYKKISSEENVDEELNESFQKSLKTYKELLLSVDKELFLTLKEKIEKIKEQNLTLEEELVELNELKVYYDQFAEMQSKFTNTYGMYTTKPLKLSSSDELNISIYLERKEIIQGYIQNNKNIEKCKFELEDSNNKLIEEEKRKINIEHELSNLDEELKKEFLSLEGRLLDKSNGRRDLKYTSVQEEYKSIEVFIDDNEYVGGELSEALSVAKEKKETLKAAEISYTLMPNSQNKKILKDIELESTNAEYRVSMLKLLELIYKKSSDYDEALEKREKIQDLIKCRKKYIDKIGKEFYIDPFSRLKIEEQIDKLKNLNDNSNKINLLRNNIINLNRRIEELEDQNIEGLRELSDSKDKIKESDFKEEVEEFEEIKEIEIKNEEFEEPEETEEPKDIFNVSIMDLKNINLKNCVRDNQIIGIRNVKSGFNWKMCLEKTTGVLKRVNSIISPKTEQIEIYNPDLLVIPQDNREEEDIFKEEKPFEFPMTENLFNEVMPFEREEEPIDIDNMFKEEEPFEKPVLFHEKAEEKEEFLEMPDMNIFLDGNNSMVDLDIKDYSEEDMFWQIEDMPETTKEENIVKRKVA